MLVCSKQYLKNIYSKKLIELDTKLRIEKIKKEYIEKTEEIKKYLEYRRSNTFNLHVINKIDEILGVITSIISEQNFIEIKILDDFKKNIIQIDLIINTSNKKSLKFNLDLKESVLSIIAKINLKLNLDRKGD